MKKSLLFTKHAALQMKERLINKASILNAIRNPAVLRVQQNGNKQAVSFPYTKNGRKYCLIVVFAETARNYRVVTVFITSKIKKYL